MTLYYRDCSGKAVKLDKYHLHELVDRLDILRTIVENLIEQHPAGFLVSEEVDQVVCLLGKAYQKAGEISFENYREPE